VVDSLSVTLGVGLLVLMATEAADAGAGLDEVAAVVEEARGRMRIYGAIDTLENLHKGGRIGGARAMLGSLLNIKPVIEVRDGVVEEESKQRTRSRSLAYVAGKVSAVGPIDRLAAFGADAPDLDVFLGLIANVKPASPLIVGDIGPVIGTHAGPGAVGVAILPAK
jgi:DegV family protein with EDD domain